MAWAVAVPAALSVIGAGAQAAGTYKGGQATQQADLYKAAVARNNQIALNQAADRAVDAGVVASDVQGLKTGAAVGAAKTRQAAGGIDVNVGSAPNVRAGIAQAGRYEQLVKLSDANLSAYGYRVKAAAEGAQAGLDTGAASGAASGAAAGAVGSLFSKASSLPFNWLGSSSSNPASPSGPAIGTAGPTGIGP